MSQQASSSRLEKMAALKENADTKDYSILVTGATGFVGERVCNMLLQQNLKIRVLSRNPSAKFDDLVIADLTSDNLNKSVFSNVTTVIHLAGHAHDLNLNDNSEKYFKW